MKLINDYAGLLRTDIIDFINEHPQSTIHNEVKIFDVYKASKSHIPVVAAIATDDDKILAYLIGSIFSEKTGIVGSLTSRCIVLGGVLYKNKEALHLLLKSYSKELKQKPVYTKISNPHDSSQVSDLYKQSGFDWEPHLNFIIDLGAGEEVVWKKISETRRKQIKRGQKRGLTVKIFTNTNEVNLKELYDILKITYDRASLPLADYSFFESFLQVFGKTNQVVCICVLVEEKIVGHRIILLHKKRIHDWYAGALPEYYEYYPNDIAVWATLKWGLDNGYQTFDFGGAGHPDKPYGVRDFKRKFGGDEVNYGVYTKIHQPIKYQLLQQGIKLYQSLKKKK